MMKIFYVERKNILYSLLALVGMYILMLSFVNIIMVTAKPDTYGLISGGVTFIISLFYVIGSAVNQYSNGYNNAVKFGVTRKNYLIGITAFNIVNIFIMIIVVKFIGVLDNMFYQSFYGNIIAEADILSYIKAWQLILGYVTALGIGMFAGSMIQKFGSKILWIFWVLYFVILYVVNKLEHFEGISNIEMYGYLGGAALVGCVLYGVYVLLNQEVK